MSDGLPTKNAFMDMPKSIKYSDISDLPHETVLTKRGKEELNKHGLTEEQYKLLNEND